MQKDKEQTKGRIIDAFAEIITEQGFKGLGINAIADKAGVGKVLIYRYFGGIEGVLKAYLLSGKLGTIFKPERLEELTQMRPQDRGYVWAKRLIGVAQELRKNPAIKALLLWELSENNEVLTAYTKYRNEQLSEMIEKSNTLPTIDTEAITSLLSSAVVYLALAEDKRKHYITMDLQQETSWERIEKAISFIYEAINEKIEREKQ
jgi:AcrR family transcriptional regulator